MSGAEKAVFFQRLRTKLAIIIAAAMLPAGAVAIHQALSVADRQQTQSEILRESEAQERAAGERNLLVEVRESMNFALRRLGSDEFADLSCDEALKSEFQFRRWLLFAALLDDDGNITCKYAAVTEPNGLDGWEEFRQRQVFTIGPPDTEGGIAAVDAFFPDLYSDNIGMVVGIDLATLKSFSRLDPT